MWWSVVWIGVGVAVGLSLTFAALRVSRDCDPITAEQLVQLGVVFAGTGVVLMTTVGLAGLAVLALGVVYMGIGATRGRPSDS